jgi:hypothetical protein
MSTLGTMIIIDDGYFINNGNTVITSDGMVMPIASAKIISGTNFPIISRWPVTAAYTDADTRPDRCPGKIIVVRTPGYPGGCPFISRYP